MVARSILGPAKGKFRQLRRRYFVWRLRYRDGGDYCSYCDVPLEGTRGRMLTVDHVVPQCRGGRWRLRNLRLACYACNHRKSDASVADFLDSRWLDRRRIVVRAEYGERPRPL